mmetsp:Transcript_16051/g.31805  ORF Transcript_16051/g.31805 Transcript_16051/m.31805 type:complete len:231 (+) Transcript_16051:238-930(+)
MIPICRGSLCYSSTSNSKCKNGNWKCRSFDNDDLSPHELLIIPPFPIPILPWKTKSTATKTTMIPTPSTTTVTIATKANMNCNNEGSNANCKTCKANSTATIENCDTKDNDVSPPSGGSATRKWSWWIKSSLPFEGIGSGCDGRASTAVLADLWPWGRWRRIAAKGIREVMALVMMMSISISERMRRGRPRWLGIWKLCRSRPRLQRNIQPTRPCCCVKKPTCPIHHLWP